MVGDVPFDQVGGVEEDKQTYFPIPRCKQRGVDGDGAMGWEGVVVVVVQTVLL